MHVRSGTAYPPPGRSSVALDRLFGVAIVVGSLATLGVLLPGVHGHVVLPAVDLVLDTVAFLVATALTVLAWFRFRETAVVAAVYHSSAFLVLATAYGIALAISLVHSTSPTGLGEPEGVQVMIFAFARLAAAVLFVVAGTFTARATYGWYPRWILVAPALCVLLASLVGLAIGEPPDALQILQYGDGTPLPHSTPFGAATHLATAVLFFLGALASRRLWHARAAVLDGWIAVGLVFAGFGEVGWALYPSAHPGQVSTGDAFLLACSISLLVGLAAAVRSGLRDLRAANADLADLRDAEVERAALEERTRLARELHDGLAQDLWLAKLRTGELTAMTDLPPAAMVAARAAAAAVDQGLGEAREAVAALRAAAGDEVGFGNVMRRTVEEYGDRFGLRVEFACEGDPEARIAPRTQAEILRITQEALTNVARHADATVVGVRLAIGRDRVTLRVVDNGRGFDPSMVRSGSFGLASMRERTTLIGGRIRVASRVGEGTRVLLSAPFVPTGAPAGGPRT